MFCVKYKRKIGNKKRMNEYVCVCVKKKLQSYYRKQKQKKSIIKKKEKGSTLPRTHGKQKITAVHRNIGTDIIK